MSGFHVRGSAYLFGFHSVLCSDYFDFFPQICDNWTQNLPQSDKNCLSKSQNYSPPFCHWSSSVNKVDDTSGVISCFRLNPKAGGGRRARLVTDQSSKQSINQSNNHYNQIHTRPNPSQRQMPQNNYSTCTVLVGNALKHQSVFPLIKTSPNPAKGGS